MIRGRRVGREKDLEAQRDEYLQAVQRIMLIKLEIERELRMCRFRLDEIREYAQWLPAEHRDHVVDLIDREG